MALQLNIIIPQYNEDEKLIKHLLTSIENQIGISQDVFDVTIVNDHSDYKLSQNFLNSFNFRINYLETPINAGAGRARQYGLEHTSAPYIMFCDADDILYSVDSLMQMMQYIRLAEAKQMEWNYVWGNFYEEQFTPDKKGYNLIEHNTPSVIWMHGKIWNRAFLEKYKVHFHPTLRTFEDTYFGKVVSLLASKTAQLHCDKYVYFWKRNPNSVTANWNHDQRSYLYWNNADYITCTQDVLAALYPYWDKCERWKENLIISIMFSYFLLQMPDFQDNSKLTQQKRVNIELLIADLIKAYGHTLTGVKRGNLIYYYSSARNDAVHRHGLCLEKVNWNEYLQYLDNTYNLESYSLLGIIEDKLPKIEED